MTSPIEATKRCPFCAELILAAAVRCKHCQADLSGGAKMPAVRAASPRTGASEFTGIAALAFPVVATAFLWIWVAQMSMLQDPSTALLGVTIVTIVITAFLVLAEAHSVGAGGAQDLDGGTPRAGPLSWFLGTVLFWAICFPAWFYRRKVYGLRNLLVPGILSTAAFLGSSVVLGIAIETQAAKVRASLANIGAAAVAPTQLASNEAAFATARTKYINDRDALRRAKPQTEADVVRILGRRPDNVIEMQAYTMLHWYYETAAMSRDVIQVTLQGGKITVMNL